MTSYNGPATLADQAHALAIHAHLIRDDEPGRQGGWGGFVKCDPDALAALVGSTVSIRMPDGRGGTVVILGGGKVEGSGDPPFGD